MNRLRLSSLTALSLILLLIFSSCDKDILKKQFSPKQEFSVPMTASKGEKQFGADIICNGYSDITIAFTHPSELSGFSISTTENGYTVNAFGVPDSIEKSEISNSSLLNVLVDGLRLALFSNHQGFNLKEGIYSAELDVNGILVTVGLYPDGLPASLDAPGIDFYAVFEKQG